MTDVSEQYGPDDLEGLACDLDHVGDAVGANTARQCAAVMIAQADALETLAGENERLRERLEIIHVVVDGERVPLPPGESVPDGIECRDETIRILDRNIAVLRDRLAKLAPVVEAARGIKRAEEAKDQGEWVKCHEIMYRALATLEAAHD